MKELSEMTFSNDTPLKWRAYYMSLLSMARGPHIAEECEHIIAMCDLAWAQLNPGKDRPEVFPDPRPGNSY